MGDLRRDGSWKPRVLAATAAGTRRGGTDAVQHAEGGQPREQMGAVELGERRLLLLLGALAKPERADVG
eukprot:scaffold21367_cov60-Phaeocystis_antarctica.AAC.1